MKKQFALIAIALSTLAAGTAAQADEETYVPPTHSTLSRAVVQADLAAWRAAGLADEGRGEQTPDFYSTAYRNKLAAYQGQAQQAQASTLSRAQVQADLAAWRAAGLADAWRGNQTPDVYSAEYRGKLDTYRQTLAQQQANRSVAAK